MPMCDREAGARTDHNPEEETPDSWPLQTVSVHRTLSNDVHTYR